MSIDSQSMQQNNAFVKDSENASMSLGGCQIPNFVEIQSEDDDEMMRHMQMIHGGRIKKYKKDKSLGILC